MANEGGGGGGTGLGSSEEIKQGEAAVKRKKDIVEAAMERVGAAGGGGSVSVNDPLVYFGTAGELAGFKGTGPLFRFGTERPVTLSLTEAASQYHKWDDKTRDKFLSQVGLAGYDTSGMKDGQLAALWASYAQQAAEYYAAGKRLTPWDILAKDMASREAEMAKPRTITQTSTAYDISTRADAQAIFLQAAQSLLGRGPTKSEVAAFQKALNAYEKAHPTVTTTTQRFVGQELQAQESTTEGGVKEGARTMLAMEDIKKDPEYGAYQAATNGMNWLMEMIGG